MSVRMLAFLLGCLLPLFGQPAHADELRPGYLELTQRDAVQWKVIWKAPLLGGLASRAKPQFPEYCRFEPRSSRLQSASLVTSGDLMCDKPLAGATVGLAGMESSFTDALLRVAPLGTPIQVERLTSDRATVTIASAPGRWQVAKSYLGLGIEHILTGYDHLLFVVALVLLLGRTRAVIKAVTAFTVAHSITLAGSTLGKFGLAQAPVEALIALSIMFLAVEIAKQDSETPRLSERASWIVAFLFGLLHGFGFAGALREIGLPNGDLAVALLTFNLGVEAGQLVIIAGCLTVLAMLGRFASRLLRPVVLASSYVVGTVSSVWFLQRMIG